MSRDCGVGRLLRQAPRGNVGGLTTAGSRRRDERAAADAEAILRRSGPMIWNPGAETLSRRELTALQLERLRTTLQWASERIAFYREALAAARVTPESIRSLDDLPRIPFTGKAHLPG